LILNCLFTSVSLFRRRQGMRVEFKRKSRFWAVRAWFALLKKALLRGIVFTGFL
jgi:hypothetical protein